MRGMCCSADVGTFGLQCGSSSARWRQVLCRINRLLRIESSTVTTNRPLNQGCSSGENRGMMGDRVQVAEVNPLNTEFNLQLTWRTKKAFRLSLSLSPVPHDGVPVGAMHEYQG
jgi:hypothetical protein